MAESTIKVRITGDAKNLESAIDTVSAKVEQVMGTKLGGIVSKSLGKIPIAATTAAAGIAAVGTAAGIATGKLAEMSDQYTLISSRISIMNDGMQSNKALLDMIYASANRARGSYYDMADTVAKLGTLAGEAFDSNEEMIFFAEQLNKQFKIGGASIQEQTAGMYQLTQAMASGRLQGDEFRSIMENAPMLAQAIAQEMGVPVGKLREMSSEGAITAEVIKNALVTTAEETNEKFDSIPMTFADSMQLLSNTAMKAFEPVLSMLGGITQSEEFSAGIEAAQAALQGFAAITYAILAGIKGAWSGLRAIVVGAARGIQDAFSAIPPVMTAATAAMAGYAVYTALLSAEISGLTIRTALLTAKERLLTASEIAQKAVKSALKTATAAYNAVMGISLTRVAIYNKVTRTMTALTSLATIKTKAQTVAQNTLNAVMAMNPVGIVIALLVALAAAFAASSIAANGLKATLSAVWTSIVHTTTWAINGIISMINTLIGAINKVGSKLGQVFKFDYSEIEKISEISADAAQEFVNSTENLASKAFGDITGTSDEEESKGPTASGGKGGGGGNTEAALNEAKRLHDSITDEWAGMFQSKVDLADRWREKELEELEKSKAVNTNYEQDRQMIMEMYAKKREEAIAEEEGRVRDLQNKIRDLSGAHQLSMLKTDSQGNISPTEKLVSDHEKAVNEIKDKWDGLSQEYAAMSARDQSVFIEALNERGIAYNLDAQNRISFEKMANDEIIADRERMNKELEVLALTQADKEQAIKDAMRTQDFEALQTAMDSEYVAQTEQYELKKAMMAEYQQAVMDSYFSMEEMLFQMQSQGFSQLKSSLSGLLQGTVSVQKAFQDLGKTLLKTVSDYISNWITARLKQSLFGDKLAAAEAAKSTASAAAQLPIIKELALQKSLATWGASATAGAAAYQAASAVSLPAFANGGMVDSPTVALIGEGKYKEAVVPFNEKTFNAIGEGVAATGAGGGQVVLNISAIDASSFSDFMERGGIDVIKQKLFDEDRNFNSAVGVW